jgi:hypothetical protein
MNEVIKETIEIRPNCVIEVTYTHLGAYRDAPLRGDTWDAEHDHSVVGVTMTLPTIKDYKHTAPYLDGARIFGFTIDGGNSIAVREVSYHGSTVRAAYTAAQAGVAMALESIAGVIDRRNARLQQRSETLTAARVGSPFAHTD